MNGRILPPLERITEEGIDLLLGGDRSSALFRRPDDLMLDLKGQPVVIVVVGGIGTFPDIPEANTIDSFPTALCLPTMPEAVVIGCESPAAVLLRMVLRSERDIGRHVVLNRGPCIDHEPVFMKPDKPKTTLSVQCDFKPFGPSRDPKGSRFAQTIARRNVTGSVMKPRRY